MKRIASNSSHRDEKVRSSRSEDKDASSRLKAEEERVKRRREWMRQQEREREHERLKKKMILEYEIRRAREKGLPLPKGRLSHRSHSRSRSRSLESQHRRSSSKTVPKTSILSDKFVSSDSTKLIFKGPEGIQVSATELKRIKVDIHRNIPGKSAAAELKREILNPEDVVLKRREGEGSKPIFEREEIIGTGRKSEEVKEHRTVIAVYNENSESKSGLCSKHTASPSPVRSHNNSPRHTSSRHFRHEDSKYDSKDHRSDRERASSRSSRDCRIGDKRHRESRDDDDHSRERKRHRDHSHSRERESRKRERDSHHSERSHREYRDRSRERSRERRDRDRSREHRIPPTHYIEQIPVPIYWGNFPPRPIMVGPLVPIRGQVPLGNGRHLMRPMRPFPPSFMPPDMYRLRPAPNPRFGPMY